LHFVRSAVGIGQGMSIMTTITSSLSSSFVGSQCAAMIDSFWQGAQRQCHNSQAFYAIVVEDTKDLGKVINKRTQKIYEGNWRFTLI